ncbi:MAG: hypothetical protein JRI46_00155 [Deltaproteobacteria bacterium]|nr:hypothetical protein [Deltaproteobacteria bacterium]
MITKRKVAPIVVGIVVGIIIGAVGSTVITRIVSGKEPLRTLHAPFDMPSYFYPSGWMGDGESGTRYIQLNTTFRESPRLGDTDSACIKIRCQPGPKGWAGIFWQYPDSNWGDQPGSKIVGATRIVFWAKGEIGGEIVEFKAGGIRAPNKRYRDSFEVSRGRISLPRDWARYEISLSGQNLSHVIGAFAWVATRDANPNGLTFYIDDIRYE